MLKYLAAASPLALSLAVIVPAAAQTAPPHAPDAAQPTALSEVVVTAQRRSENLKDVPASVQVVTGVALQAAHIDNIAHLQEVSPSLIVTQSNNPSAGSFTIRGVGTQIQNRGFEQSVGVYIDGVYRGRPASALQDLVDITSVEVLRGPQSTLFGRNNDAGAINIATQSPSTQSYNVYAEATYGNYNTEQGRLSVNLPLVKDELGLRIALAGDKHDGYVDAPLQPGGQSNTDDRQSVRAQLLWTPTDHTRVRIIGDYSNFDDQCCALMPLFVSNAAANGVFKGFTPPPAGTPGVYQGAAGTYYNIFSRTDYINGLSQEKTFDHGLSAEVDQDVGDMKLVGIASTRYDHSIVDADVDGTNAPLVNVESLPTDDITEYSAELRLQSASGKRLEWIAGAYFFDQIIDETGKLPIANTYSRGIERAVSGALFGQATFSVTDQIKITGGLRVLDEEKTQNVLAYTPQSQAGSGKRTDVAPMGTAAISYEPTKETNFYLRYSRGFKSGAFNLNLTGGVNPIVLPETADAYEVGAKVRLFENRVTSNVAIFTETVNNQQVQSFNGVFFTTQNAAELRSNGVEFDTSYRPFRPLTLNVAATYLDAAYTSFPGAPGIASSPIKTQDLSGRPPPDAPKWTLVGSARYEHPITNDINFTGIVSVRYSTHYYTDLPDTPVFANGDTTFVDASIEFALRSGVSLQLWGRNLTQQNAILTGIPTPVAPSSLSAFANDPRTYGVTLRYRY